MKCFAPGTADCICVVCSAISSAADGAIMKPDAITKTISSKRKLYVLYHLL